MNHFVVLGQGNSSTNVIEDSLFDLAKDSTFHVYTYKTNEEGVCRVYDWLIDNKATYIAYHDNNVPNILLSSAAKVVESTEPIQDMVEVAKSLKATVLYLWDEENSERSEEAVTTLIDMGIHVLDLTQGLTPFSIVEETKEVNDTVDSLPAITRSEYEEMTRATLDTHAKAQGINPKSYKTKEELVDALVGEVSVSETKEASNESTATVIVVFQDQTTKVVKTTEQHATELLSKLK